LSVFIFTAMQATAEYGGHGLGLHRREAFAQLLGGEIHLRRTPGMAVSFTLYLPLNNSGPDGRTRRSGAVPYNTQQPRPAGRRAQERVIEIAGRPVNREPGDLFSIVEYDPHIRGVADRSARDKVLGLVAAAARMRGIPRQAFSGVGLTDVLSCRHAPCLTVLSASSSIIPDTAHPVQIITLDDDRHHALARGRVFLVQRRRRPRA